MANVDFLMEGYWPFCPRIDYGKLISNGGVGEISYFDKKKKGLWVQTSLHSILSANIFQTHNPKRSPLQWFLPSDTVETEVPSLCPPVDQGSEAPGSFHSHHLSAAEAEKPFGQFSAISVAAQSRHKHTFPHMHLWAMLRVVRDCPGFLAVFLSLPFPSGPPRGAFFQNYSSLPFTREILVCTPLLLIRDQLE